MRSKPRGRLVDPLGGRTVQGFSMQHLPGGSPLQLPAENPTPQIRLLLSHKPLRAREVIPLSPLEASTLACAAPSRHSGVSVEHW